MKIVGVVGPGGSGKTSLIVALIQEFSRRGLSCGVLKMAEREIELDPEGKDSWRFLDAGAKTAAVETEKKFFLIKQGATDHSWLSLALSYFPEVDLVFIEGGKTEPRLKKILVATAPEDIREIQPTESVVAVVSERNFFPSLPHFLPQNPAELADFLWTSLPAIEPIVQVKVDGRGVSLNPFVENMFQEIIAAMLRPLKGVSASFRTVSLLLKK